MAYLALLLVFVVMVSAQNKKMETPGFYQGDISLTPEQRSALINSHSPFGSIKNKRWTDNTIPYVIHANLQGAKNLIDAAIADYHRFTCLKFVKKTWRHKNYVQFIDNTGCNSAVGMQPGLNKVSLDKDGCWNKGTILHEIGHAIGLEHEQARSDRDTFVTIHEENLDGDWKYAFDKSTNINSLNTLYDFRSMMHYSSTAFAKPGTKTITTKNPRNQKYIDNYNQITGFSVIDVQQIRKMYGCAETGIFPNNCVNKDSKSDCEYWKKQSQCTDNKQYMYFNCRKACNVC